MGLRIDQLDFDLDDSLIAVRPAEPRESARLMVLSLPPRDTDDGRAMTLSHRRIADLPDLLGPGDRLVLNETRVVAARLHLRRRDTGGRLEGLLLERLDARTWWSMLRRSRRLRAGHVLEVLGPDESPTSFALSVEAVAEDGRVRVAVLDADPADPEPMATLMAAAGRPPLPPYVLRQRRHLGDAEDDPRDPSWYQTAFATDATSTRSVAAPTAGLHLTPDLLARIDSRGVETLKVSLEVGAGTFKPVEVDDLDRHPMHEERCLVDPTAWRAIERADEARGEGHGRVVAVGTTSVRTLESMPEATSPDDPVVWSTDLLIQPGHRFRRVDALLTNFHLPRSTLLALVAAMVGLDRLHRAYAEAIREGYRFFSYGDAMFIHRADVAVD